MAKRKTKKTVSQRKKAVTKKGSPKTTSGKPFSAKGVQPGKARAKASGTKATPQGLGDNMLKIDKLLFQSFTQRQTPNPDPVKMKELENRVSEFGVKSTVALNQLLDTVNKINPKALAPIDKMPEDRKKSLQALTAETKRFHGIKTSLAWFPFSSVFSLCADKFGYLTSPSVRAASKLPFNVANQVLLGKLGEMMGDAGRENAPDSNIPAGYTYFGQFVDHDITFDVSSTLNNETDANIINNMRSPALELDSLYGRGPALDAFLYAFPSSGPSTAIKFQLGTNKDEGPGGPGGTAGVGGMKVQTDFDIPRVHDRLTVANTAVIGDPRNDENLIISQFHQTMLRLHNKVVDLLILAEFSGDIFVEAKRIVTHHYQWAVVHDFLVRVCGATAVNDALSGVSAPKGSPFRMPVEFAVAAYRFGHSMIRNNYWLSFVFPNATLAEVFQFNRKPDLPVWSKRVVDFNAFFTTGVVVPVNNKARKIDSVLANGLESIPGGSGIMAVLATRNLRRGLALGLPSGQGIANFFNIPAMTTAQLIQNLPANEVDVLNLNGGILLKKTPLWYYVLREAAILGNGDQLGPVGARIVADTFIKMLRRDANSFLNVTGGFIPILPSGTPNEFTVADLVNFAGVTQP